MLKKLKSNEDSEIENNKNLIIDIFPNIYLESFNNLKKLNKTFLPINPKFIYMSMNLRVMNCLSFIVQKTLKIVNILLANMVQPMGRLDKVSQLYNLKVEDSLITWGWEIPRKTKGYLFPKLINQVEKTKKITFMTRPLMPMWNL